ncbi:unnamed protein product [Sphagnum balticum]
MEVINGPHERSPPDEPDSRSGRGVSQELDVCQNSYRILQDTAAQRSSRPTNASALSMWNELIAEDELSQLATTAERSLLPPVISNGIQTVVMPPWLRTGNITDTTPPTVSSSIV